MSTIDNIAFSHCRSAHASLPKYAGVPMRSPATSIVLAQAVKRSKRRSPSFQAAVKARLCELIVMLQSESPSQGAECQQLIAMGNAGSSGLSLTSLRRAGG